MTMYKTVENLTANSEKHNMQRITEERIVSEKGVFFIDFSILIPAEKIR